jgi:NTP pyrophosphatase (non-canonical NTP hydrolase)
VLKEMIELASLLVGEQPLRALVEQLAEVPFIVVPFANRLGETGTARINSVLGHGAPLIRSRKFTVTFLGNFI